MAIRFSIVVATLNRGPYLGECLKSILAQGHPSFEVIVVDGGSTDDTASILSGYGDRIRVLHERGQGPGGARNMGVEAASGEFAVFVDSDDVIREDALRIYDECLQTHGPARMLLAQYRGFSSPSELAFLSDPAGPISVERFDTYLAAAAEGHLSGTHRLVIDRNVYLTARGLSTALPVCEDQDFGMRINTTGGCLVVHEPATIAYRAHASNISGDTRLFHRGALWMIKAEQRNEYPGGSQGRETRRFVISRTSRSASIGCLRSGQVRLALQLYWETLPWHLRQGRLKYALGFPLLALARALNLSKASAG